MLSFEGTMASTTASAESGRNDSCIKSRDYQMEMLEESLKGNVIIAVCLLPSLTVNTPADDMRFRCIPAAVKHTCEL